MVEKVVVVSDAHIPFADERALRLVCDCIDRFEIDHIIVLGDWADFYQISAFSREAKRLVELQSDLDKAATWLEKLAAHIPGKKLFKEGNHEHRMVRYLNEHPAIASLRGLTLPSLLRLDDLGFIYYDFFTDIELGPLTLVHGDIARAASGYTARAMLDRYGTCGISGHTHRLGASYRTTKVGVLGWWENGCLCEINKGRASCGYAIQPNWQQGFSTLICRDDGRFDVTQVPIIEGEVFLRGETIK